MAKEHEKNPMIMPGRGLKGCISKDLLCEHKEDSGVTHFALGLCEACYKDVSTFFLVKLLSFLATLLFDIYCCAD